MRLSLPVIAFSAAAVLATTATAFAINTQVTTSKGSVATSGSGTSGTCLNMAPNDFVQSQIDSNSVVVFSKTYCPYCKATKELFTGLGVDFAVHELDTMGDEGPEIQMALFKLTGQKSVPNVFVKGKHIGGNDDTQAAARQGKLQEMLGLKK